MIDLQPGTTLIEASAGTGKTYTLCRIALQLTLQKGIALDRILAVTFTEAATEELATRLRQLYQECLHQLDTGKHEEQLLVDLAAEPDFDLDRAKQALRYSLEVFDEAPISTIHGYCKRALELVALETRTPLDAELSPVENQLVAQLQNEYLRQQIFEASPCLAAALPGRKGFDDLLAEIGRQCASHPQARLRPQLPQPALAELDRRFASVPEHCRSLLDRAAEFLPHLSGTSIIAKRRWLVDTPESPLAQAARRGFLLPSDFEWLSALLPEKWTKAIKQSGKNLPTPPLVDAAGALIGQIDNAFAYLAFHYRSWLSERLQLAKEQANVISFNDLLHLLHRALQGESGARVADLLADRCDAALIDEFQDTDRIQFSIAQKLFGGGEHYLFFIGDPKQSIYRFRGADIFAYFKATQGGSLRKIHLEQNFRSTPGLVQAVNTLFSHARAAFVDPRIAFHPVHAARSDLLPPFLSSAPFSITQLSLLPGTPPPGKGDYRHTLAERAANDFARRLNSDPSLRPEDVTFLVNDRLDANALNDALRRRGIVCSLRADRSVFETREASDLLQLLAALASPARSSLKRGAYARLSGGPAATAMLDPDFDERVAPFMECISDWARNWSSLNFNVAFKRLTDLLLDTNASEQRHANFAQLAELLSEACDDEALTPRGLLNWLRRKQDADVSQNDEWQTRISSDEGKPQILTIHKSKGLQFPIVILPFVGLRRIRASERSLTYHDANDELVIDISPEADPTSLSLARDEALAEDARLLYVALTRAVYENTLYLAPEEISSRSGVLASSFGQLLLGIGETVTSERLREALESLVLASDNAISLQSETYGPGEYAANERQSTPVNQDIAARPLAERIALPGPARILSFSALSRSLHLDLENAALALDASETGNDEASPQPLPPTESLTLPEPSDALSIFTLPKGAKAGDLLHLILENFDFSQPDTLAATTVQAFETLRFEPRAFEPIVAAQIAAIAQAELPSAFGSFRLADVPPERRIAELEFGYPVSGDTKQAIASVLQQCPTGRIPAAWTQRFAAATSGLTASMLRGFIDLVIEHDDRLYIVDWKSNYLGDTPACYTDAAMVLSMSEHDYFLQYLLYCVALKRHLAWRFPDRPFADAFGGVFYIYARGVTPGSQTGIYYDLPSHELLDALDENLHPLNAY